MKKVSISDVINTNNSGFQNRKFDLFNELYNSSVTFFWVVLIFLMMQNLLIASPLTQIFILHSYTQEYPWTKSQHTGFMEAVKEDKQVNATFVTEYLDTKRHSYDENYAGEMEQYLKFKYEGYKPTAIYVTDDDALVFARDHLSKIFPGVPVFFTGINNYDVQKSLDSNIFTGVFELKDVTLNLKWLLGMDKNANDLVFIGDGSSTYQLIERDARKELNSFGLRTTFIVGKRLDSIIEHLHNLPGKYIFLTTLGSMFDANGQVISLREIVKSIANTGRIVISMEDGYIMEGVLGGYVTSGKHQGKSAANLLLTYLHGKPITDIPPVLKSPNAWIFDDKVLQQQNIELPDSIRVQAEFLNPRLQFYDQYRTFIIASLLSIAVLLFLVVTGSLLIMRRKNRELNAAQNILQEREKRSRKQKDAILTLAIDKAVVSGEVTTALKELTKVLSDAIMVDRVSVWRLSEDGIQMGCLTLYEKSINKHSSGSILKVTDFPNYFKTIFSDSLVVANDAQNDPRTNEFTEVYLKPLGITSMLDSGIWKEGKPIGVVCFEHVGDKREWHSDEEAFANTAASIAVQIFSNSERKQAELALLKSESDLRILNSEKDKFFSIIAHDLKSPFVSFLGLTEILIEDINVMSKDEIKKYAKSLNLSANNLFRLLTNLLEWSMMQRGVTKFNPSKCSVTDLIGESILLFKEQARNKKIKLAIQIPENTTIYADEQMILAVIRNLISNALKFTSSEGLVTISAIKTGKFVNISVKDTGIGIGKDILENLFKIDNRSSRKGTDGEASTGLGLILSKEFVEKNGGIICVESEEYIGSKFYFTLPLAE